MTVLIRLSYKSVLIRVFYYLEQRHIKVPYVLSECLVYAFSGLVYYYLIVIKYFSVLVINLHSAVIYY